MEMQALRRKTLLLPLGYCVSQQWGNLVTLSPGMRAFWSMELPCLGGLLAIQQ